MTSNGQRPQPAGGQEAYPGGQEAYPGGQEAYPGGQEAYPGGQDAYPGAPPSAPSFEQEIHDAVEYERGLAVKALLALGLVALVLVVRVAFFG